MQKKIMLLTQIISKVMMIVIKCNSHKTCIYIYIYIYIHTKFKLTKINEIKELKSILLQILKKEN